MSHSGSRRAGRMSGRAELLRRADAAAEKASELAVDWLWIRLETKALRAERLSSAVERAILAAHRAR